MHFDTITASQGGAFSQTVPLRILRTAPARLRGPGGCYNLANLLALAAGIAAQVSAAAGSLDASFSAMLRACFHGEPGAAWLTAAVSIFLAAGEAHHRAWLHPGQPSRHLLRLGDLLSGLGASALTLSLLCYGDAVLAILSGLLLAFGKFGNAAFPGRQNLAGLFRRAALLSRAAVLASLAPGLAAAVLQPGAAAALDVAMAWVLVLRTLICCRGDYLLLRAG
ncbi:hypothetical protein [Mangrovicoccus sp. HB161399]|uniref:hypothetical protein n=1 Tax=Mangrovicoccus sp. HB161399 TaxID=2720392 RepID=UPI00155288F9|nr:hypothetical protein [Mangrovicoccus sp. HB161399]